MQKDKRLLYVLVHIEMENVKSKLDEMSENAMDTNSKDS